MEAPKIVVVASADMFKNLIQAKGSSFEGIQACPTLRSTSFEETPRNEAVAARYVFLVYFAY